MKIQCSTNQPSRQLPEELQKYIVIEIQVKFSTLWIIHISRHRDPDDIDTDTMCTQPKKKFASASVAEQYETPPYNSIQATFFIRLCLGSSINISLICSEHFLLGE